MTLRKKLLLAAALLLVPCAIAELALRARGYDPFGGPGRGDWRRDLLRPSERPGLVYELVPGARGTGWNTAIEVNSAGFRDREFAREKPPGTLRIAAIGDSLTFGNGVVLEATYPKVLERRLAEQGAARGLAIEVLNLGIAGYDAAEAAYFLEGIGLEHDPDLVVLGYCINDAGAASVNRAYVEAVRRYSRPIFRSRLAQWIALRRDLNALREDFWTINEDENFVIAFAGGLREIAGDEVLAGLMSELRDLLPDEDRHTPRHAFLRWYGSAPHVGRVRYAFERLAALRRERGLPVLVAVLPYLDEGGLEPAYDLAYAIVRHEAERVGLDVVELAGPVRAAGPAGLRVRGVDALHFNGQGHDLIAEHIGARLAAGGLLEAARRRIERD